MPIKGLNIPETFLICFLAYSDCVMVIKMSVTRIYKQWAKPGANMCITIITRGRRVVVYKKGRLKRPIPILGADSHKVVAPQGLTPPRPYPIPPKPRLGALSQTVVAPRPPRP